MYRTYNQPDDEKNNGLVHDYLDGVLQSPGGPEEDTEGAFNYGGWVAMKAPDPRGLIPAPDVKRLKEWGDEIKRRYGNPVATTQGEGDVIELADILEYVSDSD